MRSWDSSMEETGAERREHRSWDLTGGYEFTRGDTMKRVCQTEGTACAKTRRPRREMHEVHLFSEAVVWGPLRSQSTEYS